jgi:hypothetical protein
MEVMAMSMVAWGRRQIHRDAELKGIRVYSVPVGPLRSFQLLDDIDGCDTHWLSRGDGKGQSVPHLLGNCPHCALGLGIQPCGYVAALRYDGVGSDNGKAEEIWVRCVLQLSCDATLDVEQLGQDGAGVRGIVIDLERRGKKVNAALAVSLCKKQRLECPSAFPVRTILERMWAAWLPAPEEEFKARFVENTRRAHA